MEEEIRKTIYELIVDILKTYVFPTEKTLYEGTLNEFISRLGMQYPHLKEKLLIEKEKFFEDANQLIVGCIYVIAEDTKEGSLKTADIMRSVQIVNPVLEQMNIVVNREVVEETTQIL